MTFVRLVAMGFIALTIVYWSVWLYSRSVRKERLEKTFDQEFGVDAPASQKKAYVAQGMEDYHKSIRPKLIGLVYVVPTVVVVALILLVNAN